MTQKKPSVWVKDFDDTEAMNEWQYSAAFAEFYNYLYMNFTWHMPNIYDVSEMRKEIDDGLFVKYGIDRGRVAKSMLLTYEEICKYIEWRWGVNLRADYHKEQIRRIGDLPFDYTKMRLLDNAKFVLAQLKERGDSIYCLTCYDKNVFPMKRQFLDLDRYFDGVKLISKKKTKEDFIEVSGWTPEVDNQYDWYAVGNGPSDILPVLEISQNWRGFYVPHGSTSALFKGEAKNKVLDFTRFIPPPIDDPRVITVRDVKDILNYI